MANKKYNEYTPTVPFDPTQVILQGTTSTGAISAVLGSDLKAGILSAQPKVYRALLTQSGTSAPVATVIINTIGTITWNYEGLGSYSANSLNLFTANKTWPQATGSSDELSVPLPMNAVQNSVSQVIISSTSDEHANISVEILVYP